MREIINLPTWSAYLPRPSHYKNEAKDTKIIHGHNTGEERQQHLAFHLDPHQ